MTRRALILTTGLGCQDGWTRYSEGFVTGLRAAGWEIDAAVEGELRSRGDDPRKLLRVMTDAWRLRARAARADIIHAMVEPYAPLASALSIRARKPYLVSVHGTFGDRKAYPAFTRPLYDRAFALADAVLPVSRYTSAVLGRSFRPRRVEIIPGGVKMPEGPISRSLTTGRARLHSVGALKPRKGFHVLVEAVAALRASGFMAECDIAGEPPEPVYASRLRSLIAERGLAGVVRLLGRVEDAALETLYRNASLFVLPSEHDGHAFEGLGLVYLEAMSRGTPVIGTRDSGAEDVIRDGENGFLVAPGDTAALVDAIRRALGNPEKWKRLSDAGLKTAENFRWERAVERMNAVYESLTR